MKESGMNKCDYGIRTTRSQNKIHKASNTALSMVQGSNKDRSELARLLTNSLLELAQDSELSLSLAMAKIIDKLTP